MHNLGIVNRAILMENGLREGLGDSLFDTILRREQGIKDNLGDRKSAHRVIKQTMKRGKGSARRNQVKSTHTPGATDRFYTTHPRIDDARRRAGQYYSQAADYASKLGGRVRGHLARNAGRYKLGAGALSAAGLGYGGYKYYKARKARAKRLAREAYYSTYNRLMESDLY